jgi:hypothetical protein
VRRARPRQGRRGMRSMFGLLGRRHALRLAWCHKCGVQIERRKCGMKIIWHVDGIMSKKVWLPKFSHSSNTCLRWCGASKVRLRRVRQRTKRTSEHTAVGGVELFAACPSRQRRTERIDPIRGPWWLPCHQLMYA